MCLRDDFIGRYSTTVVLDGGVLKFVVVDLDNGCKEVSKHYTFRSWADKKMRRMCIESWEKGE